MAEPGFDAEGLFGEDYLYFYRAEQRLRGDRSENEADLICRLAELVPRSEVLDLACGHGRLAIPLAQRGHDVTGLDLTQSFLDQANHDASVRGVTVEYVHGDMRDLPWVERFDAVVNWSTAFGYFDDADNRLVLGQVFRVLRPGGRFLLELENYTGLLRRQSPAVVEHEGNLLVDRSQFDPLTGRDRVRRTMIRDGRTRHVSYSVRMFTFTELRDWLLAAGFTHVTGYGEDGSPLTVDCQRMIVLAQR